MENKSTLNILLKVGFLEGLSYLLLLFIAMPLKYFADMPMSVRYVGMVHGVLFVAFVVFLFQGTVQYKWSIKKFALGFILSLLPFGTFYLEKTLKKEA